VLNAIYLQIQWRGCVVRAYPPNGVLLKIREKLWESPEIETDTIPEGLWSPELMPSVFGANLYYLSVEAEVVTADERLSWRLKLQSTESSDGTTGKPPVLVDSWFI
jgi:hypothetical protein